MNTIDKRYYEASELDLEGIRALAKSIAEKTKKEPRGGPWHLAGRREDQEIRNNGKYEGDYWAIYDYYLRGDGELCMSCESHTDTIHKQEKNKGAEKVLQEKGILLFDFKPHYYRFENRDGTFSHDRDPSDEVIVPWKGFGMKSLLYGLLAEPVKIRERANGGDAYSQWRFGFCYFFGAGIRQDFAEAVKWFQKSAKQGNADGQFALGRCYQYGCGLTQDLSRARQWYGDAAAQGYERAKTKIDQDLRF